MMAFHVSTSPTLEPNGFPVAFSIVYVLVWFASAISSCHLLIVRSTFSQVQTGLLSLVDASLAI